MKRFIDFFQDREKLRCFIGDNRDMIIKVSAAAVAVVVAFFVFTPESKGDDGAEATRETIAVTEESRAKVYVDIGGEVRNPMVAELEEGSRVEDAIAAAGGLTENADISQINRAAFIEDGEKIFIPPAGDITDRISEDGDEDGVSSRDTSSDGRININTADSQGLQQLAGVGPATAEKIIAYRKENGPFKSAEELKNVSGIGDKTFDKLKDMIRIW